jgi:hypothetical protein
LKLSAAKRSEQDKIVSFAIQYVLMSQGLALFAKYSSKQTLTKFIQLHVILEMIVSKEAKYEHYVRRVGMFSSPPQPTELQS